MLRFGLIGGDLNKIAPPPTAPSAVTLSASEESTVVNLSWEPPASGGEPITSYEIFQDSVSIGTTPDVDYQVVGLTDGVAYTFTVTAINLVGSSPLSNAVTITPLAVAPIYDPIETSPDWDVIFGGVPSNAVSTDRVISFPRDTAQETRIGYKQSLFTDGFIEAKWLYDGLSTNTGTFPMALRIHANGDCLAFRMFSGAFQVFEYFNGFRKLTDILNINPIDSIIRCEVIGNIVTVYQDGVEIGSVTTTLLTEGAAGMMARDANAGNFPYTTDYVIGSLDIPLFVVDDNGLQVVDDNDNEVVV